MSLEASCEGTRGAAPAQNPARVRGGRGYGNGNFFAWPVSLLLTDLDWPATSQKLCGRPFPVEPPAHFTSKSFPQPPGITWPLTSVDEICAAVVTLVEKSRRVSALAGLGLALGCWGVGSVPESSPWGEHFLTSSVSQYGHAWAFTY